MPVERAREAQAQRRGARRQRPGRSQRHRLVAPVETRAERDDGTVHLRGRVLDPHVRGVQDDLRARALETHVDAHLAPERRGVEVGLEMQVIVGRSHVRREAGSVTDASRSTWSGGLAGGRSACNARTPL